MGLFYPRGHLLLQLPREQRLRVDASLLKPSAMMIYFRVRAATDGLIGLLVGVPMNLWDWEHAIMLVFLPNICA